MNRKTGVGALLLRFAENTLHPVTVDRVVLPALADLQHECAAEGASVYTRVRAYGGVLKALAICVAGDAVRDRDCHLAPLAVRLLAALAILVLLLTLPAAANIVRFGESFGVGAAITLYLLLTPSSIPLALPCALFFALALHRLSGSQPAGRMMPAVVAAVLVSAIVMTALVTVLMPIGNRAWRNYIASQFRSQGHSVTLGVGLSDMTWSDLNDRIRHPASVRAEVEARAHRQDRIAMVLSVFVLAPLGVSLAGRWRSRLGTLTAAVALLALYSFCFTHGWNNSGRFPALWAWSANAAFFVLGVGLIVARVPRAAGEG
jgi:lipopolysaccharide export system permease LptF/LptG-like protein